MGGDAGTSLPGSITIGPSAVVQGDTTSTADPVMLDLISDAEYDWAESVNRAPGGLSGSGFTYNPSTGALSVKQNGIVTMGEGVYFFKTVSIKQNAQLTIVPNETVNMYVTASFTLQQNATANLNGSPANLILYLKGTGFSMFQDSKFYGALYAPEVTFKGRQDMGMYGSVVARSATLHQDACFHFDRSLIQFRRSGFDDVEVVAWRDR